MAELESRMPDPSSGFLSFIPKSHAKERTTSFRWAWLTSFAYSSSMVLLCVYLDLCRSDAPVDEQVRAALAVAPTSVVCRGACSVYFSAIHDVTQAVRSANPNLAVVVWRRDGHG